MRIVELLLLLPSIALGQQIVMGEYPIPTANSSPNGIAAGPDGALWFTENAKIGRITTAGAITEYPIGSAARVIVAGPDGAYGLHRNPP
jgi:virginiamycin B lyase